MGIRTDLAVEIRDMYHAEHGGRGENSEIPGVVSEISRPADGVSVTRIEVIDRVGERIMGKPVGNYITIETDESITKCRAERRARITEALAGELRRLVPFNDRLKVLVAGLGNEKITPDSLGPATVEKVRITRHYFIMYDEESDDGMACVSGICPGVMGTTGLESAEVIRRAAEICGADVIIAIDALAARSLDRVNTTVQISDTGIAPGSGTGNMRMALNEKTTGARVIAVGIPTVTDAKTIIMDTVADTMQALGKSVDELEKKIDREKLNMIVTSSDIDQVIKDFSDIIADALNMTLLPGVYSAEWFEDAAR